METLHLPNNKTITTQRFAAWYKMTSNNEHNRVRIAMAQFFNDIESGKELIKFCRFLAKRNNAISHEEWINRIRLTNRFMSDVRQKYGDIVVLKLNYCL